MTRGSKILIVCVYFFITFFTAKAQNNGTLSGYVLDSKSEEPLIGATVRLKDSSLGAVTDINGFYSIKSIPAQTYAVEISYVGYRTQVKYNVVIKSGGNPDLDIQLEEEAEVLEGVVITANPFDKIEETPLSIQKLSSEEIATYPGGNNDIAKVVQSLPGVSGSIGGFRNDVIIRGGAPNENVYYLDGIEIPNINHFSTQGSAGGPVGMLNVSFFEGVTLSTSSFGAQYDNVLSGVLQFDQRNGNNREFRTNFRLSSSESAFTFEGPLFKGINEQSNTSFIASVRRSYLQLLFKALDFTFLPDYWDYQYKVSHKLNDHNDLIFTGLGSIDDFSVNSPESFDEEQQATLDQIPIIKQWSTTHGVIWKNRFKNAKGYMTTALSTNVLNNDFKQYEDNVNQQGLYLNNVSQEQETKFRYTYNRFINDWVFSTGTVVQFVDYSNETLNLVNNFQYDNNLTFTRYGFFAQASHKYFNDRLGISGGIRFDGNTFTASGNEIFKTFSPRASLSYALDKARRWTINASAGRYFKIPPYTILGFTDNEGNSGNNKVDYIQNDHVVAGLEYLVTPSARITVEGFYKKYDNYPVSLADSVSLANLGGDFSVLGNEEVASIGLGRSYGVEFLYQQKLTNNFYAILAYTLYKSEFTGFDPSTYLPSSWDSGSLITFTGGYKFGNNWELSARVRYAGKTPYAPVDQQATLENYPAVIRDYGRLGQVNLDPFNQTDIRLDKKWNFKKWTLDVFLELQNILSQNNPSTPQYGLQRDDQGNVIEPRQLKLIEGEDTGQLLPTIGVVIDF